MTDLSLPKSFEALEPLVASWALATQDERQQRRIHARGELRAFYEAMLPRIEDILSYVDRFPLGELPPEAERLFALALSLAEVAPHIELYGGDPKVPHSFDESRFVADHGRCSEMDLADLPPASRGSRTSRRSAPWWRPTPWARTATTTRPSSGRCSPRTPSGCEGFGQHQGRDEIARAGRDRPRPASAGRCTTWCRRWSSGPTTATARCHWYLWELAQVAERRAQAHWIGGWYDAGGEGPEGLALHPRRLHLKLLSPTPTAGRPCRRPTDPHPRTQSCARFL
jgi:hypothetical protein